MSDAERVISGKVYGLEQMRQLGASITRGLDPGDVVLLHGDLGAGKTTLAQAIAAALGVEGPVQSPTFTFRTEYPAQLASGTSVTLHHLDLYRVNDPEELGDIGWDELITSDDAVTIVEWPERAADWLPEAFILVSIAHVDADSREVRISTVPDTRGVDL